MKKFLLSCALALVGIGANAQFTANYNFSDLAAPGVTWFGAGGPSTLACSAPQSFFNRFNTTYGQTGGPVLDFSEWAGGQTNNGNKIDASIKFRKAAGFVGTMNLVYAEYQPLTDNWSITPFAQVAVANAAITTCQTLTGTIPAGTLDPAKIYAIGGYFQRTGATTEVDFMFDDLVVTQETTVAPGCTTISSPLQNAVVNTGSQTITWNTAAGATGYKLTVGTTSGGSDVYNSTVTTTSQAVALPGVGTTYYAKVIPTNASGDALGCTEISFKTCDGSSTVVTTTFEEKFNLSSLPSCWSNQATSGAAVWTFVASNGNATITPKSTPYMAEFRTTSAGNKARLITAPLDITAIPYPALKFNYANVNWAGDIDELRVYYKTSAAGAWTQLGTNYTTENTTWKEITLALPNKSATYYIAFEGTSNWARGINLDDISIYNDATMAVSDINKVNISVYPNPFTDVLNISDVKGVKSVSVNDISGREVKSLAPSAELNLSSLKAGLYIVNLKMEDGSVKTFKAIKK
ncbi:T9SS type A sorting domain-containing protein [Epilithonimonas xixisoli]|uniref:Putative secreted protein (Por secretion system target) n=1 Tax=Epilithonimonas xixisoli TaxID=1476462 RepID=A0A4V3H2Q9_9FLAO|nr:T9SS type A sorting domain-containing protein [Epilithonimonas xixisoli]TDX86001.1 putative secreted protein (Por secretion system target) [Epilithonimonas xixisoli]